MADPLSRRDIDFLLHEWLDVTALTERERFSEHSRDTFDDVLSLSADMAIELFATHNKKGDQNEPYVGEDGKAGAVVGVTADLVARLTSDFDALPAVPDWRGRLSGLTRGWG